jgi:hypothetical protein
MYAKFPFYSIAQMYALTLNTPVAIMLGMDHLYWVVDQNCETEFIQEGCSVLSRQITSQQRGSGFGGDAGSYSSR